MNMHLTKPRAFFLLLALLIGLCVDEILSRCPIRKDPEPSSLTCDCQRLEKVKRIVGGNEADAHEYPFQVLVTSMYRTNRGTFAGNCGGTLISAHWVLTAAHCVVNSEVGGIKPMIEIRVGEHVKSSMDETDKTEVFFTTKFIVHHKYRVKPRIANDIALIYLATPVKFTDAVSPACLPSKRLMRKKFNGQRMTAVGWGRNSATNKESSDILKEIELRVYSGKKCTMPKFRWSQKTINKDMLCGYKEGENVCNGDSGGPLIFAENGHTYVVGVASFVGGPKCAYKKLPGVFVRVASYIKWIQKKTGERFCTA